ncbi:hypothetical protein MPL3356_390137 [Mesorhizobium plurifarium]|uniref:Uncharacterized protein n=1 Tax=Mesorhizobium plurifarium TaxID=69974 RepID=A0A090E580_MESPL|nr:hypothetical protein MPL3356_390137 [Mesorhizobium plurifarium]
MEACGLAVPFRNSLSGITLAKQTVPADPGPGRVPDRVVGSPGSRCWGSRPAGLPFGGLKWARSAHS